jgi:soluble lytic murein transglycosylase-like protein
MGILNGKTIKLRHASAAGTALAMVILGVAGARAASPQLPFPFTLFQSHPKPAASAPASTGTSTQAPVKVTYDDDPAPVPVAPVESVDLQPPPGQKAAAKTTKTAKEDIAGQPPGYHVTHVVDFDILDVRPRHKPGRPKLAKAPDFDITAVRPKHKPVVQRVAAEKPPAPQAHEEAATDKKSLQAIEPAAGALDAKAVKEAEHAERALSDAGLHPEQAAPVEQARLPANVLHKSPSLLDRVFGPGNRLSDDDAARYAHIFAFQDTGDFIKANAEIEKLSDTRLMGHVLSQRYRSPKYKATYAELSDWMKAYADHPGAARIYEMALHRKPRHAASPPAPRTGRGVYALYDFDVGQLATPYIREQRHSPRQRDVIRAVNDAVSESPTMALKRLERQKSLFEETDYDSLRADIAASYFYNGKPDKARELATASAKRSGEDVPLAAWISGLSAWREGDYAAAAQYFALTAESDRTSAWMASAGAHWAARACLRSHQPEKVGYWLRRAAQYPRTFYGIISMKALGMEQAKFNWDVPDLDSKHIKALAALPAGRRALALVDSERPDLAEAELGQMNPGDDPVLQEAMIALASRNGMPGLAMRMGSSFKGHDGRLYDAALYPNAPWEPGRGFSVDKALVYAFIRQESQFQPGASNSYSGAIGLMQLMPDTARHVARLYGGSLEHDRLEDPMVNIDLGQKYLSELLKNEYVENNLFKLAVAYNAGPGKLARWEDKSDHVSDPLLFIESIPVAETRIFVERVIANYWIYRIKYHQDTASLDKVAEGDWPIYLAQDHRRGPIFAAAEEFFSQ